MAILAYHMVDPRFSWGITRVTPRLFEKHLQFLLQNNFQIQTISEYLSADSTDRRRVAITFDDGYESVYRHAFPILRKHQAPASVFIAPAYVGQYNTWDVNLGWRRFRHLSWEQLADLRDNGWEVGAHGWSHCDLSRLDEASVARQLAAAAALIRRRLGVVSPVLSYPFGNVSALVARLAKTAGYTHGLTMGMLNDNVPLHYSIRRTGVYLFDLTLVFRFKLLAKYNSFFNLVQRGLDVCSSATVRIKLKNWTLD